MRINTPNINKYFYHSDPTCLVMYNCTYMIFMLWSQVKVGALWNKMWICSWSSFSSGAHYHMILGRLSVIFSFRQSNAKRVGSAVKWEISEIFSQTRCHLFASLASLSCPSGVWILERASKFRSCCIKSDLALYSIESILSVWNEVQRKRQISQWGILVAEKMEWSIWSGSKGSTDINKIR